MGECEKGPAVDTSLPAAERIRQALVSRVLDKGRLPASVYSLARHSGVSEEEFYAEFGSVDAVVRDVLRRPAVEAREKLASDEGFKNLSTHDRVVAFDFAWIENLTKIRSFLLALPLREGKCRATELFCYMKSSLTPVAEDVLSHGEATGAFAKRRLFTSPRKTVVLVHFGFVFRFWLNDESRGFERTDQAVERAGAFLTDLLGRSVIDSGLDLAKFLRRSCRG